MGHFCQHPLPLTKRNVLCVPTKTPRRLLLDAECKLAARDGLKITPSNLATRLLEKKMHVSLSWYKAPLAHCLVIELWSSDTLAIDTSVHARLKGPTISDVTCYCKTQERSEIEMNKSDNHYWANTNCANES